MKITFFRKSNFPRLQKLICLLLTLIVTSTISILELFTPLEIGLQEIMLKHRNSSPSFLEFAASNKVKDITLVLIDDNTLKELNLHWPIPRSFYAQAIEKINQSRPKAIGVDVTFEEKSPNAENDEIFAEMLRRKENNNVVLSYRYEKADGNMIKNLPFEMLVKGWSDEKMENNLGFVDSAEKAKSNGVIRDTRIIVEQGKEYYYSFDALLIAKYLEIPLERLKSISGRNYQMIGDIEVPISSGAMWIDFMGCKDRSSTYFKPFYNIQAVPFVDIANDKYDKRAQEAIFKDKIVIIGVSAEDGYDIRNTPIGAISGPEIHVNILLTILHKKFIKEAPVFNKIFIVVIPCLLLALTLFYTSPAGGILIFLLMFSFIFKFSFWNFEENLVFNQYATSLATLFLTYISITSISFIKSYKEQTRLKSMLLELAPVPEPVLDTIMQRYQGQITLGGEKVNLTILFSDIRGYTSFSQNLDPQEVMKALNEYFTAMAKVYKKYGGMNFDIMGDGQMIVFGAAEPGTNHALMASKSALEMMEELEKLNEEWNRADRRTIKIGIGINTGEVSLGFLGSHHAGQRKQFSAIGDATNVASRLETLTKDLNSPIIISATTYEQAKEQLVTEDLPPTKVKGKDMPLKIYKLIGIKEHARAGAQNAG